MIKLSYILPLYKAKYIGWLVFESLVRQKNINFKWELIIVEEEKPIPIGIKKILKYEKKLKKIGCSIKYRKVKKRMLLSDKIAMMITMVDPNSKAFMYYPADYYAPPTLISYVKNNFCDDKDYDCLLGFKTINYNLRDDNVILHDTDLSERKDDTAIRAIKMELIYEIFNIISKKRIASSIDHMIWQACNKVKDIRILYDYTDQWKYGFNTDGLNNISVNRSRFFKNFSLPKEQQKNLNLPFRLCDVDLNETIPKEIMTKLKTMKKFIELHKEGR